MTEDEMKKTWCPHVRVIGVDDSGPINRWETDHDDVPNPFGDHNACIGSACSQWRWVVRKTDAGFMDPPHGYCGIAGPP